jgi:putative flippase GtrA
MPLPPNQLVALMVAVTFSAGLNVYATVATLGLMSHTKYLDLPPSLHLLSNWGVIAAALVLFASISSSTKSPPSTSSGTRSTPSSASLSPRSSPFRPLPSLTPAEQLAATLAGGAIAFIAHGGKTAVRAVVTPTPEPFSNIALSLGEDSLAIFLTWLSTWKPYIAAAIAFICILVTLILIRFVFRSLAALRHRRKRAVPA